MRRIYRYGFAVLRGHNTVMSGELKCKDDYERQLASDDPEMMAAVFDFHQEIDAMLAELDRELMSLKRLVALAYREGGGQDWKNSEARKKLHKLME